MPKGIRGKKSFKFLKYKSAFLIRTFSAGAILCVFLYAYLNMGAGNEISRFIMWRQFTASAAGYGIIGGAAAVFLAAALLTGRVFCSVFCPMGAIQEFVWRISAKLGVARKKYVPVSGVRYIFAALAAVGLIFASPALFALPDPISNFGRGVTSVFLLARGGATALSWLFAGIFAVIVAFACLRGRRFCDWCPAGAVLGFAAGVSPFGMKLDKTGCLSCGICERACPMNCVDASFKKIDSDRCVLCFGCASACPGSFIGYGDVWKEKMAGAPANRRGFIKKTIAFIMSAGYLGGRNARNFIKDNAFVPALPLGLSDPPSVILPPGAETALDFFSRCIGCQACVSACPVGVIKPEESLQPQVVYGRDYCQYSCVECGRVCPTGALRFLDLEEKRRTRVALSKLTLDLCVVITKHQSCGACAEVCPTRALHMEQREDMKPGLTIPVFDEEYCIGCGACLCVCPADPKAFEILPVERQSLTSGIRPTTEDEADESARPMSEDDDFPF
jgi:ferredoxin